MPNDIEQAYELTLVLRSQLGDEAAFGEPSPIRDVSRGLPLHANKIPKKTIDGDFALHHR